MNPSISALRKTPAPSLWNSIGALGLLAACRANARAQNRSAWPSGVLSATKRIFPADVVTFGDNLNDVEMLRWAGLGVAMGNAVAGAKEAADEVTLHHEADGVAVVIERLLGL